MAENGYWATKTYHSGMIGEKVKFFVPYTRIRKQEKSTHEKIMSNENNIVRTVTRCINDNFCAGDGWLTLTYTPERYARVLARARRMRERNPELSEQDAIWFAADHEGRLLMDRARSELKKRGIELRYLLTTSDMDKDTGEIVRVHHHVIVGRECVEVIKAKWGTDEFADPERPQYKDKLWHMKDYTPLAEYMIRQVRHIPNAKKYVPSRNLMRPQPKPRKVISGARLRAPKGCEILYADPYTGRHDCQYIRYLLPPEKWTGVWKGKTTADVPREEDFGKRQGAREPDNARIKQKRRG